MADRLLMRPNPFKAGRYGSKPVAMLVGIAFALLIQFSTVFAKECADTHASWGRDLVRSLCGPNFNPELIEQILRSIPTTDGKKKVQCGLPGTAFSICTSCSNDVNEGMMNILRPFLTKPEHREYHANWHQVRADADSATIDRLNEWKKKGWITEDLDSFKEKHSSTGALSGEDFLYMHRIMLQHVQLELALNGQACIAPWDKTPKSVDDPIWPVPADKIDSGPVYLIANNRSGIQKALNQVRTKIEDLKNPEKLRSLTLSQLGKQIENGFHVDLHFLYENKNSTCSSSTDNSARCDDLIPSRSALVNKHFWKLHGLVDQFIGLWLEANGYKTIAENCDGRSKCYQWKGTWVGARPSW